MKLVKRNLTLLILLILSACGQKPAPGPTPDISGIQTVAVATVYASITEIPTSSPTPSPDPCARTKNPTEDLLVISSTSDGNSYYQTDGNGLKNLLVESTATPGSVEFSLSPNLKKAALLTGPDGQTDTELYSLDLDSSTRTPILAIQAQFNLPPGAVRRYLDLILWSPTSDKILFFEYLGQDSIDDSLDKLYLFDFSSAQLVLLAERNGQRAELVDSVFDGWSKDGKSLSFLSGENYTTFESATLQETTISLSDLKLGKLESPVISAYLPETNQLLIKNRYTASPGIIHSQYYLANLDGSGLTQVTKHESDKQLDTWSPEHKKFSYVAYESQRGGQTWFGLVDLETGQETTFEMNGYAAVFSPDNQKIAVFLSERGQLGSLIIFSFQSQAQVTLPTRVEMPTWSPDGRDLFFLTSEKKIMYFDTCESQNRKTPIVIDGRLKKITFK